MNTAVPFHARHNNQVVKPHDVDADAELYCRKCSGKLHIVSAHERDGGGFVPRHFSHNPDRAPGSGGGCGGGESDRHEEMKTIALSKATTRFELEDWGEEEFIGHHRADAYARLAEPRRPWGVGFAIEVQHKNEDKDIDAVTDVYLDEGYTAIWLWEENFAERSVDLFDGDVVRVWPNAVPDYDEWRPGYRNGIDFAEFRRLTARYHRDGTRSENRRASPDPSSAGDAVTMTPHDRANAAFSDIEFSPPDTITARLPSEWYDERAQELWSERAWDDFFSPPTDYTDIWCYSEVPATLPPEWHQEKQRELWRTADWRERFHPDYRVHLPTANSNVPARLHLPKWLTDDGRVLKFSRSGDYRGRAVPQSVNPPAQNCLIPESLLGYITGDADPEPPANPYNDVQCRECGQYWHHKKNYEQCPECGEPVDWEWNIHTGRIEADIAAK